MELTPPIHATYGPEDTRSRITPHETPICDFCSGGDVTISFPTADIPYVTDFVLTGKGELPGLETIEGNPADGLPRRLVLEMLDGWAACEPCGALVLAGDKRGLVERVVQLATSRVFGIRLSPRELNRLRADTARLYDTAFWPRWPRWR